ncbi:hypothetical protein MLD38_016781 [Melastoma candidum]|uniref:Uncharacterized protein n=1 Tax=Melastoma candidum TaxID=119954 RepID=A0ACB9QP30_9MYRT|nr:hypothetical protein MLD38_016781 [Melastoma candidum]
MLRALGASGIAAIFEDNEQTGLFELVPDVTLRSSSGVLHIVCGSYPLGVVCQDMAPEVLKPAELCLQKRAWEAC